MVSSAFIVFGLLEEVSLDECLECVLDGLAAVAQLFGKFGLVDRQRSRIFFSCPSSQRIPDLLLAGLQP